MRESERQFRLTRERRHRLCALHARPERHRHQLECRRRTHQGLYGRRDHRTALLAILSGARSRGRRADARAADGDARKAGSRPKAGACARMAALFWANVVIDRIRDDHGDLMGFAKITRDITERRDAQLALQKAQTQLAQTQKMDALGQLTGGVAHDFNNLLMVVSGHTQLLKERVSADPRLMPSVEAIEHATTRGEVLTRQLLTFARRHIVNPSVFELPDRIEAFSTMIASSIGATVKLVTTINPKIWLVKVDPNELELALVNITLNARDAMPKGGVISFTAENITLSGNETFAKVEGDFVALRITDTGTGIPPDLLPKVFDPFFTTKPAEKGSGLGLSQVYGFAHQSGGTMTVESELGKGTTVTLYLPRGYEMAHPAEDEPEVEGKNGGRVLLVEDNPEVAEVSVSLLQELGYQVRTVADATAALEAIDCRRLRLGGQ